MYQARLRHSPDAINPHNYMTIRTPHASIFDAGLAAHETRLMRHIRSTTVFMKTPYRRQIQVITTFLYSDFILPVIVTTYAVTGKFSVHYLPKLCFIAMFSAWKINV